MLQRGGPGPSNDRKPHQQRVLPGLLARRGSGPARGSHSCYGPKAVRCWSLELDGRVRRGESAWDLTGDQAQGGFTSPALALGWCDPGLVAGLRSTRLTADFGGFWRTLLVLASHASCLIYPPQKRKRFSVMIM